MSNNQATTSNGNKMAKILDAKITRYRYNTTILTMHK